MRIPYEKKYEIMYKYLLEHPKEGIKQDTVYMGYPIGNWQSNMRIRYYAGKKLNMRKELKDRFLDLRNIKRKANTHKTINRRRKTRNNKPNNRNTRNNKYAK